jgi:maleate cis-trans isomerase
MPLQQLMMALVSSLHVLDARTIQLVTTMPLQQLMMAHVSSLHVLDARTIQLVTTMQQPP